ncbi:MAG: hypothetical protein KJ893_04095 [Candidatus Omnitrophica bacterium]|nr:hypothetical protein [Candidatus Omnitrophota bacterium]
MTAAKKLKTVDVEKNDYKIFLKKAKDFYEVMLNARDTEKWTAVGLNAVHCVISCCDAMLTFHLGIRSSGEDHMQAVDLLMRLPSNVEDGEAAAFKRIIAKKNLIAYECREFRQAEAIDISKLAERFYRWTTSKLPVL